MATVQASSDSTALCQWMAHAIGNPTVQRVPGAARGQAEQWVCVVGDTNPDFRAYLLAWRAPPPHSRAVAGDRARLADLGAVLGWRTVARSRSAPDELGGSAPPEAPLPCARFADTDLAAVTVVLVGYNPEHAVYAARALPPGAVATASGLLPVARRTDFPWQTFADCMAIQVAAKRRAGSDGWEWQLGRGTQAPDKTGTLGRCLAAPGCTLLLHPAGTAAAAGWSGRPARPVESIFRRDRPPAAEQARALALRPPHHSDLIGSGVSEVGVPLDFIAAQGRRQDAPPPPKQPRRPPV